jgi:hypothetical protein
MLLLLLLLLLLLMQAVILALKVMEAKHAAQRQLSHDGFQSTFHSNVHVCMPPLLLLLLPQAVTLALKGMEAKHAAERQLQEHRLVSERNKASKATEAADAAVYTLKTRITQLRSALIELSTNCYSHPCASATDRVPLLDRESSSSSGSGSTRSRAGGSRSSGGGGSSSSGGRGVPLLAFGTSDQQQQQQLNWGPSLSTGLGPRAVSACGERWLYMHLPEGPWRKARQLLLQPLQEMPEGLMRESSSGKPHVIFGKNRRSSAGSALQLNALARQSALISRRVCTV